VQKNYKTKFYENANKKKIVLSLDVLIDSFNKKPFELGGNINVSQYEEIA
jgi:hypothetical protein